MQSGATTSAGATTVVDVDSPAAARSLIDAIPDALIIHDEHGEVLDVNHAACRLYGFSHEALLTRNLLALNPGLPEGHLRELVRAGGSSTIEAVALHRNGREIPVEIRSGCHCSQDRLRIVSVLREIGHWQRATSQLRETEQRESVLLNSLEAGVIVREGDGGIAYANPAAYRMFHVEPSELPQIEREGYPGWRFTNASGQVLSPRDFPSVRALQTGVAVTSELICYWLPHVHTPRWVYLSATPLCRSGETLPCQVVATLNDVTHLKRTRDLLEQTQALGRVGGFELTLDANEITWTSEMYRLFDLPEEFPLALDRILALFVDESRQRIDHDMALAVQGHQPGKNEYEIVTPLGRRRWISAISHPILRGNEVVGLTGSCQDITERKLLEQELRRKAATDPLTGLPNRDSIVEELDRQIGARHSHQGPALLYVDLDRFRTINAILGAAAGDRLLRNAASRLLTCLPVGAHCGRFAGDEFLVVLSQASVATDVAAAINQAFRQPFRDGGEEFLLTASIGIAYWPDDGSTAQQLLKHADAAMDEAKQRGRGNWQMFSPMLASRIENHLAIENQLRHALQRNEFRLLYQPQIELDSGRVVGAEALLRWQHPVRGELPPQDFVQHAERSGEIVAIGAWAIDEACRQLQAWRDAGLGIERIAVNVSPRQLLGGALPDTVAQALQRHRLPGNALELEMVERTLISDTPATLQTCETLRAIGVAITIDDFGEGYSSLNYLRWLPIDGFKISYEFMRRVPASQADAAICEALIRIGKALDLGIVAEGVENEAQRAFLLRHGMRLGQGHLFSHALDGDAFKLFARAHA